MSETLALALSTSVVVVVSTGEPRGLTSVSSASMSTSVASSGVVASEAGSGVVASVAGTSSEATRMIIMT